jgi:membrane protein
MRMTDRLGTLESRLREFVWGTARLDELPWWRAWFVTVVRYVHVTLRDLSRGEITHRAASLAYTTLLSFVPLLAVSFSVLKGLGVHNQLEPALLQLLAPMGAQAASMAQTIVGFVDNMKVGVLGAVGIAMLLYTVVSAMMKVEDAFNYSWRIRSLRTMTQGIRDYLIVLIVGPVLVFAALGITGAGASNSVVQYLSSLQPFGTVLEWMSRLAPYLMIIGAFTFLYVFLPNTRVRLSSALVGGVVGGILWQTAGWGFARFVAGSTQYAAVYSAFAGLVIFFVWIYVAWLILLVGANIAFYHQHPEHLCLYRREPRLSLREREALALCIVKLIAANYYAGRPSWTVPTLSRTLMIPESFIEEMISALEQAGLLARGAGRVPAWLPARPLDTTSLAEVMAAVRNAHDEGMMTSKLAEHTDVAALLQSSDDAAAAVISARMVKELAATVAAGTPSQRNDY